MHGKLETTNLEFGRWFFVLLYCWESYRRISVFIPVPFKK